MYAGLYGEIYLYGAGAGESYGGFYDRLFLPGHRDDAAVVVGVRVEVEDADTGDRAYVL